MYAGVSLCMWVMISQQGLYATKQQASTIDNWNTFWC